MFQRGRKRITVQRWRRPDRVWELTVIWPTGEMAREGYVDVVALIAQHMRLERELAKSGWALREFKPERRKQDRRRSARPCSATTDRRKLGRITPLVRRK